MYKVGTGSDLRSANSDQHRAGQLNRVSSVDDCGRRFADRIRRRCQRGRLYRLCKHDALGKSQDNLGRWHQSGGGFSDRTEQSVSAQSVFASGRFSRRHSQHRLHKHLSVSCHDGNSTELWQICKAYPVDARSVLQGPRG